jgi:hypothetical protein
MWHIYTTGKYSALKKKCILSFVNHMSKFGECYKGNNADT